jgi:hypothetical protein
LAKADSEIMDRFDKSHGSNVNMQHPKKPPTPRGGNISSRASVASYNSQNSMWDNLIERTCDNNQVVKRGDYALSS